jgi:hypothetical protein
MISVASWVASLTKVPKARTFTLTSIQSSNKHQLNRRKIQRLMPKIKSEKVLPLLLVVVVVVVVVVT